MSMRTGDDRASSDEEGGGGEEQVLITLTARDYDQRKLYAFMDGNARSPRPLALEAVVLNEPSADTWPHTPAFLVPSRYDETEFGKNVLCSNEEYFDCLFGLLSMRRESVFDLAWSLLMLLWLPVLHDKNTQYCIKFRELTQPKHRRRKVANL